MRGVMHYTTFRTNGEGPQMGELPNASWEEAHEFAEALRASSDVSKVDAIFFPYSVMV